MLRNTSTKSTHTQPSIAFIFSADIFILYNWSRPIKILEVYCKLSPGYYLKIITNTKFCKMYSTVSSLWNTAGVIPILRFILFISIEVPEKGHVS